VALLTGPFQILSQLRTVTYGGWSKLQRSPVQAWSYTCNQRRRETRSWLRIHMVRQECGDERGGPRRLNNHPWTLPINKHCLQRGVACPCRSSIDLPTDEESYILAFRHRGVATDVGCSRMAVRLRCHPALRSPSASRRAGFEGSRRFLAILKLGD
jgi:hypothetical protein